MSSQISIKPYRRTFRQPLRTARGQWAVREGFIVRIGENDRVSYGEIAPIPDFGTETVAQAGAFLDKWSQNPDLEVPSELSCCAFGISAAKVGASRTACESHQIAALLPAGKAALEVLPIKVVKGHSVFKWKIGVEPLAVELEILKSLVGQIPSAGWLRLDANGGLSDGEYTQWLTALAPFRDKVEYLEQPLAVGQEARMLALAERSAVPIALDESLNGANGVHWLENWLGPLVVKPALMGDVDTLLGRLRPVADRVVLSSVFETGVGVANALSFVGQLPRMNRALGFDTCDAFDDGLNLSPEDVWKQLPHLT